MAKSKKPKKSLREKVDIIASLFQALKKIVEFINVILPLL